MSGQTSEGTPASVLASPWPELASGPSPRHLLSAQGSSLRDAPPLETHLRSSPLGAQHTPAPCRDLVQASTRVPHIHSRTVWGLCGSGVCLSHQSGDPGGHRLWQIHLWALSAQNRARCSGNTCGNIPKACLPVCGQAPSSNTTSQGQSQSPGPNSDGWSLGVPTLEPQEMPADLRKAYVQWGPQPGPGSQGPMPPAHLEAETLVTSLTREWPP